MSFWPSLPQQANFKCQLQLQKFRWTFHLPADIPLRQQNKAKPEEVSSSLMAFLKGWGTFIDLDGKSYSNVI